MDRYISIIIFYCQLWHDFLFTRLSGNPYIKELGCLYVCLFFPYALEIMGEQEWDVGGGGGVYPQTSQDSNWEGLPSPLASLQGSHHSEKILNWKYLGRFYFLTRIIFTLKGVFL